MIITFPDKTWAFACAWKVYLLLEATIIKRKINEKHLLLRLLPF